MNNSAAGGDRINDDHVALVNQIRLELAEFGHVQVSAAQLRVSSATWRHAARAAARDLGRRVQTGRTRDGTWLTNAIANSPSEGWSVWATLT